MSTSRVGPAVVAGMACAAMLVAAGSVAVVGAAEASAAKSSGASVKTAGVNTSSVRTSSVKTSSVGSAGSEGSASSANSANSEGSPTRCAVPPDATAQMAGSAGHQRVRPMQELRDKLARTPAGGMLAVPPGVYRGGLVIDKPVILSGIGHATLQGDGTGTVLTIRAAGTVVRDLMVEGSGPGPLGNPAGVSVQADHVTVKNLHVRDTYTGIWVEGAKDAHIVGNVINGRKSVSVSGVTPRAGTAMAGMAMDDAADKPAKSSASTPTNSSFKNSPTQAGKGGAAQAGRGDGISLFNALRPVVSGNTIVDARDGVYFEYGGGTRIECNSVTDSRYAIHSMFGRSVTVTGNHFATNQSGPVMMYGGPVTLSDNVIRDQHSSATGFGVLLLDVGGVRLLRNVLVSNRVGLQLDGPLDNPAPTAVELNTIALNQVGISLYPTANAVLSQNSIVENTVQVLGMGPQGGGGASRWSRNGVGNYWSNYRGYDQAGSGVGKTPHVEGASAGRLLAGDPTLLALASSPAFTLLRAVEQRSAGQRPVAVDRSPLIDPRSPALPPTASGAVVHTQLGTGLLGGGALLVCALALVHCSRRRPRSCRRLSNALLSRRRPAGGRPPRRQLQSGRTKP
jgi:nitrous oxidase accessory protein